MEKTEARTIFQHAVQLRYAAKIRDKIAHLYLSQALELTQIVGDASD